MTKKSPALYILLGLLMLLGIGALGGGAVLIISPSGKMMGMPLSMLNNSPFANFLVPGIILFVVLGLAPIGLSIALIKKPEFRFAELFNFYSDMHWAWTYCIYIAFALIIWIVVEIFILHKVHWAHALYILWAMAIQFVALLPSVRNRFSKK